MQSKTDMVLGTSAVNEYWEKRAKELCNPDYWSIQIYPRSPIFEGMTQGEIKRLEPKIKMVQEAAQIMMAGMVKGTLKYPTDGFDIDKWMSHLIGEGCDQMNYQILLATAWKQYKAVQGAIPAQG